MNSYIRAATESASARFYPPHGLTLHMCSPSTRRRARCLQAGSLPDAWSVRASERLDARATRVLRIDVDVLNLIAAVHNVGNFEATVSIYVQNRRWRLGGPGPVPSVHVPDPDGSVHPCVIDNLDVVAPVHKNDA
ncbi:hypothetical protein SRM_p84004 (plasmid) [Salinibacter ruber M8]|uniref:Uncharacterized protein n=1 Tax=Salinibacter ruber (strain M8) TaxID=761659 RepID=D6CVY1_SALRM|nr:hypothetical protein SRM_p84004 [Salinibacter ruber M8]